MSEEADSAPQSGGEIILYTTPEGAKRVEVFFQDETFWLNQKRLAELFGVEIHTINYHLKEIFASGELSTGATIRKFRIVQPEGGRRVSLVGNSGPWVDSSHLGGDSIHLTVDSHHYRPDPAYTAAPDA